jgi:hypothetical protein
MGADDAPGANKKPAFRRVLLHAVTALDQPMVSTPPMYGFSTSGTVMLPSAFW